MSFRSMFVLSVAVLAGMVEVEVPGERCMLSAGSRRLFADELKQTKTKDVGNWLPPGNVLGFTMKGRPFALERDLPGIQGALALTVEQKHEIATAMQETVMSESVRTAMATAKLDPNATQAQKDEARRLVDEAEAKLRERVAEVLTDEQKSLVEKINTASREIRERVSESMQSEFAAVKGNDEATKQLREKMNQQIRGDFRSRAADIFSDAQQAAFEEAAAAQAAAEKAAKDHPNKGK